MKNTLLTLQKLKAEDKLPNVATQKLNQYSHAFGVVEGTIDTWPAVLGFEEKKTYLVLFQNNMELRPGGGFIGSYALLSVENGKMGKLQIHDVYDADGKMTTHIEPPYALRRYLGAAHWYLRDSNYDPDFTKDAMQAAQFLELETGERVDGVIAVDTTFLKNLLSVLGSVNVPDYKETVTADNFYLLTQTHAEKDFFPGSTQKKDFLRSLTTAMMTELFETKEYSSEKLLLETERSVRSKHLLFAFADKGIQNVFTVNGLSSSLHDGRSEEKQKILDYLGVIDANVGANKANYYVKRSITHSVNMKGLDGLQETAVAMYNNTSEKDSPFGGDYKNYVRFLIPANAKVTGVSIDGVTVQTVSAITDASVYTTPGFIPPSELEVDEEQIGGKKAVGFFFIVPAGKTKTVALHYTVPT
ncbi:MAG: DUF4012 domain-containing protein, partial [Acidobacteriota bacterium]